MKGTFRITIILISVAIILTGIGFWRHHYLKIMNAEPIIVYKSTPLEPDKSPKDTSVKQEKADKGTPLQQEELPKDTSVKSDDNTDVELEPIDNSITPEETDNTGNSSAGTIFGDLAGLNLPPAAAAALKEYEEIQSALPALNDELRPLLKASPLDMDAIRLVNEKKRKLKQQRKDVLEILALYSDEAFNELQATIAREKTAARIVDELEENPDMDLEDIMQEIEAISK